MKVTKSEHIRNTAFLSHGGVGKTSLVDALLFKAGMIKRLGTIEEGSTTSDFTPEEKARQVSINATFLPCFWQDNKINLIDTPGYTEFAGDVHGALRVSDSAIVMVCAAAGVEINTRRFWKMVDEKSLPRLIFINKMDREGANFEKTLKQLQEVFGKKIVPLYLPMGSQAEFKGIIDLLAGKAHIYNKWGEYSLEDIPSQYEAEFEQYHTELVESLAEMDDELMMKYLEEEQLTKSELNNALEIGIKEGKLYPAIVGSVLEGIGIEELLNIIISKLPSPVEAGSVEAKKIAGDEVVTINPSAEEPLCALVAKTIVDPFVGRLNIFRVFSGKITSDSEVFNANKDKSERISKLYNLKGKDQEVVEEVIAGDIGAVAKLQSTGTSDTLCQKDNPVLLPPIVFPKPTLILAAYPKAEGDEEKISTALNRHAEEDLTFDIYHDPETKELVISGMGTMHIDVIKDISKRKFGVDFITRAPKVAYKETIEKTVEVEEKHKKQTGGRGQYGHVYLRIEPLERGAGFEFHEDIFGGAIPGQFIPGVEKGIREALDEGILAGYPVVDFKATVFDGSFHPVDSSELAFKLAASKGFKRAMEQANPILLEPVMEVTVEVPDEFMGDVIGDLNSKRGKILGMDPQDGVQLIKANVPLAELSSYATDLISITGGQGTFSMKHAYYDKVPAKESEKIIAEAAEAKEE